MRKVIITVVSFALLLGTAAIPWTAISQESKPAAADSCLAIPASAFQEYDGSDDFERGFVLYNTTASILNADDNYGDYYAPVNLPHGSTIKKIVLVCKDNHASDKVVLVVWRQSLNNVTGPAVIANFGSTGQDTSYRKFPSAVVSPRFVNNFKFTYFVQINLPGVGPNPFALAQVKIWYNEPPL